MKVLRIGDPHIKPSNIEEAVKLMGFINDVIMDKKPDRIEILGDLFHTHSIVRLEVMGFWDFWLQSILQHKIDVFILVGNHDKMNTEPYSYHALSMFKHLKDEHLHIIEEPISSGPFSYMPWYSDQEVFIDYANKIHKVHGRKVLICHQTFDGSQYENGFFAPDGVDASKIPFDTIISGHIHTRQRVEKDGKIIIYPGTPKWDTISDANEEKGVWYYEHDDNTGAILKEELIKTDNVVTPILCLTWAEGTPMPEWPTDANVTIELMGTGAWIDKQREVLKGKVGLTSKRTDKAEKKDRQPGKNFPEFVEKRFATDLDRKELLKYMQRIQVV